MWNSVTGVNHTFREVNMRLMFLNTIRLERISTIQRDFRGYAKE